MTAKQAKPLPETFTLSEIERLEFERQVVTKKWIDAKAALAQREVNDDMRALQERYQAWAQKLSRRLGIKPDDINHYNFSADGVPALKEDAPPTPQAPPPAP